MIFKANRATREMVYRHMLTRKCTLSQFGIAVAVAVNHYEGPFFHGNSALGGVLILVDGNTGEKLVFVSRRKSKNIKGPHILAYKVLFQLTEYFKIIRSYA